MSKGKRNKITLVIDGEWYQNLKRVADAMNTVSWCENDNTPESVFCEFVKWDFGELLGSLRNIGECVAANIDTGFEDGTAEHGARIAELRAAFGRVEAQWAARRKGAA